jgi:hypothetical protein
VALKVNSHITTVDVSTPENTDKMITLATNKGGASFTIVGGADDSTCRRFIYIGYGYSKDFFSRLIALGGFDINTISGITSVSVLVLLPLRQWKAVHMYFQY